MGITAWCQRLRDPAIATGLLAFGLFLDAVVPEVRIDWGTDQADPPWMASAALLILACLGSTQRRSRPLLGLCLATAALVTSAFLIGMTNLAVLLVLFDLLYCAVLYGSRRSAQLVAGGCVASVVAIASVSLLAGGPRAALISMINATLGLFVPVLWGYEVRHHRGAAAAERERAAQAHQMAQLARDAAVAAERARMARDLHDVIAGQLSAIALQSEAALTLVDADPAVLRRVLTSVRQNSVASLAEMRTMIGLLRSPGPDPEPRTAPATLAQLDALLGSARASGLRVDVVDDRVGAAPTAVVDLAAYRIVQESLTNAAKHAPGSAVRLVLRDAGDALVIEVANDLVPGTPQAGGTGMGLLGLRERARAAGGRFEAGPDGTGWRVRAVLPREPAALP
ncbi:MAG: sensor histidine kinase [Pseudonocardiaceae bacterium]